MFITVTPSGVFNLWQRRSCGLSTAVKIFALGGRSDDDGQQNCFSFQTFEFRLHSGAPCRINWGMQQCHATAL